MILRRVVPAEPLTIDSESPDARAALLALYAPDPADGVRLNLIGSVAGDAAGTDGTSKTLTTPLDRTILGVIRQVSDVVLVGAQSVRAEGYLMPRRSALAVVTASGDLRGHRLDTAEPGRLLVLCPAGVEETVRRTLDGTPAEIVTATAGDHLTAVEMLAALRDRGFRSVVCEGGPRLARQLLDAGLIDELCLSTAPLIGAGGLPLFGEGLTVPRRLTLRQLLVDDDSGTYARWGVTAS